MKTITLKEKIANVIGFMALLKCNNFIVPAIYFYSFYCDLTENWTQSIRVAQQCNTLIKRLVKRRRYNRFICFSWFLPKIQTLRLVR